LFDPVEEPLDLVASAVEIGAEADRIAAIAFRRDVGPRALLHGTLSDPVGVIAPVGKQHWPDFQPRQQFSGNSNVMGLTGAQRQPYRQTIAIDHRMDFARQAAAGSSHRLTLVPRDAGSVLMHADNGGVDHLDSGIVGSGKCVYEAAPDTSPPPADEPVVASGVWAKRRRQITPRCSGSQDPEDAVEDTSVVYPRNATRFVGQHRLDGNPFIVGEFIA